MPCTRSRYPANWNITAQRLKEAANYTCQECGLKQGDIALNRNGKPYTVVVTTAHLDHDPANEQAQIKVLCQACHCRYDGSHDQRVRKAVAKQIEQGQVVSPLFVNG